MTFDSFRAITIEDKPVFDEFFHRYNPVISELTFTNLYVWRDSRLVEYIILDNTLIIRAKYDGETYFFPPIGENVKCGYEFIRDSLGTMGIKTVKLIPERHLDIVSGVFNTDISENDILTSDRDNYDYVYAADKLANLTSRKLSSKRNFIHRFEHSYKYRLLPYKSDMHSDCVRLMQKWITGRTDDTGLRNEFIAIQNLLNEYDRFDAIGAVITVNDTIVSFAFGEPLDKETFVIHFEKADTDYVGAYQMINRLFVSENVLPNYRYVNREQDLGHEGIRRAKMSYYPDILVAKYRIDL